MANSKYNNQYFSILGDSISTLDGYNPPECAVFYDWQNKYLSGVFAPEDTWWGKVIDALGGRLLVNNSWSGSTVCKHPRYEVESYGCSAGRTGSHGIADQMPDVVMILLGLNDFGCGMRPTPAEGEDDLAVFSVAYAAMLEKISRNYPGAEIWGLTLPRSYCSRSPEFEAPVCRGRWHMEDYCPAIGAGAHRAGCVLVELYDPDEPYDTIDGYHPNADGMRTIASAVLREIGKGAVQDDH